MKKNINIIQNGFTLVESLVSILIISSISFSMFFAFYQIQKNLVNEDYKSDMISYGNRVLDDMENEIMKSYQLIKINQSLSNTTLELYYKNTQNKVKYLVSLENGIKKNDGESNRYTPIDIYNPKDEENRYKYKITNFEISQPTLTAGDIWSYEANMARYASYEIILEIDLYNYPNNKVIETLEFNRRIFSPAKFIYNKNTNNV
tara:strand:+ start:601 stop:1212 length:612 start_codon:yes stop_codon:yes gene_type:complete